MQTQQHKVQATPEQQLLGALIPPSEKYHFSFDTQQHFKNLIASLQDDLQTNHD